MNKFCPGCGQQITEEGAFCINCGYNLNQQVQNNNINQNIVEQTNNYTNGMAIAGFVISLVSLMCCCYTSYLSVVGLVFSILGLSKANEHAEKGKNLAIAGIVINSISIALSIVYLFVFLVI